MFEVLVDGAGVLLIVAREGGDGSAGWSGLLSQLWSLFATCGVMLIG